MDYFVQGRHRDVKGVVRTPRGWRRWFRRLTCTGRATGALGRASREARQGLEAHRRPLTSLLHHSWNAGLPGALAAALPVGGGEAGVTP